MSTREKFTKSINIGFTENDHKKIVDLAKERGMSPALLVREMINFAAPKLTPIVPVPPLFKDGK